MAAEEHYAAAVDVAFSLKGGELPSDHRAALWQAVAGALPWLGGQAQAGIQPLRIVETDYGVALLPKRAKLVLRLTAELAEKARELVGRELDVAGIRLTVGDAKVWQLPEATTLYADLVVTGNGEEEAFRRDVEGELARLGVSARLIFGRARTIWAGGRKLSGFPVALHDLTREASGILLRAGLGGERRLGCGILVQHKAIKGLD